METLSRASPLGNGGVADPLKHATLTCVIVRTKFRRRMSSRFGVGRGLKNFQEAETAQPRPLGLTDSLEIYSPLCYYAKFPHSRSNHTNVIMEISQKILTTHSLPFESFKIIKTDTDRSAIYDFLLVFHSNSLYHTVSEKNGNICTKISTPCI